MDVTNFTGETISVAVNQWGNDGDTSACSIKASEVEHWKRSDAGGFLMVVTNAPARVDGTYFVQAGSHIVVNATNVTEQGQPKARRAIPAPAPGVSGIHVNNACSGTLRVAVDHWGKSGNTSPFEIAPSETEVWDRSDPRGYVMSVQYRGYIGPYVVGPGNTVVVSEAGNGIQVTINGVTVHPAA